MTPVVVAIEETLTHLVLLEHQRDGPGLVECCLKLSPPALELLFAVDLLALGRLLRCGIDLRTPGFHLLEFPPYRAMPAR